MPGPYAELMQVREALEQHYRDMQDLEFTIQKGKLYMLQTRNGKRTAAAAVKIAVDMAKEKLIDEKTAILRVDPSSLDQLLHPTFDPKADKAVIATGLPASPGAAVGSAFHSFGSKIGASSCDSASGSTISSASFAVTSFSATRSVAITTAA